MKPDFPKVQDGEVITPVMDSYGMKCCECDLVHHFDFRAVRVTERLPDGSFRYELLDPAEYRVELTATRPDDQPPWPKEKRKGPGQPQCELCPGRDHKRCCLGPDGHYKPAVEQRWWQW